MDLRPLEQKLGYKFENQALLQKALSPADNQLMEFLGDSVLNKIITVYLFNTYPDKTEGEMTIIRTSLISKKRALEVCQKISLAYSLGITGQELTQNARKETVLADVFEAVIAAIYLDGGYSAATVFVLDHVLPKDIQELMNTDLEHPKNTLQKLISRQYGKDPTYHVTSDHSPLPNKFVVSVRIGTRELAKGNGRTIAEADERAAKNALKKIQ